MADHTTDNLWSRLRRRKVVQWGIAYAAGSWGVLQGLGYVTATFHWPPVLQQLATLALLVGLPIVLVVAWYHGDQGRQRVTGAELAIISLLFLVGGAMFWRYDRGAGTAAEAPGPGQPSTAAAAPKGGANTAPRNSIAVLPFVNMSGDPSQEYFSDGISEEILNVLARAPGLQVAARTSSFAYKGQTKEVPEIARDLNVRMVLEGSVRKQGDKVRVTAQLIDAQTGFHAWSETYDRKLEDIFAVQDDIAQTIGEKMQVELSGAGVPRKEAATNPEAHDHYLRGLALWQRRRETQLWQAIDEFNRAIAADPGYAPAYGGLALAYTVIADYSPRITFEEAAPKATEAAQMALALDPSLPEPYAALGNAAATQHKRALGKALLDRAVALGPSFATAYQWLGTTTAGGGDPDAGIVSLERARVLDPRSLVVADNYSVMLMVLGRYDEAIAVCRGILQIDPDFESCLIDIGVSELMLGRPGDARTPLARAAELRHVGASSQIDELVAAFEGRIDRKVAARRLAAFPWRSYLEPGSGNVVDAMYVPMLLAALGAPEEALDYVERNALSPSAIDWILPSRALDAIRCDPRFQAVEKKLAMTDVRAAKMCSTPAPAPAPAT